jgi:hypothetical protein
MEAVGIGRLPRRAAGATMAAMPLKLEEISYEQLLILATAAAERGGGHLHTTPPGCLITGSARRGIVLEVPGEPVRAFFSDESIEALAKPLAVALHGADTVPANDEPLEPACAEVDRMGGRMRGGHGHFHILNPACQVNPNPGRWTVLFEDDEWGVLEHATDERPLADIRLIERLIYA